MKPRFFFEFLNSKPGRHFEDELHQDYTPTAPILREKLRRNYVSWLLRDPLFATMGVGAERTRHPRGRSARRSIASERDRRREQARHQPRRKDGSFK